MLQEKVNILQLVNGFAIGGGELKLLELIKYLNKDKYNIIIGSVGQGGPLQKEFEKVAPVYVFFKKHKFDFTQVFKVAKLMRKHNIHIVQTTLFYADVIGAYAAVLANVPIVLSWEAVTQPYRNRHLIAYKLANRKMDRVIAVSHAIRKQLIEERNVKPEKVMTIQYGVDLKRFSSKNRKLKKYDIGCAQNSLIIGTVARFTRQKGHTYLINAAPQIVEKFPHVRFVFIGDGPLRFDLENQIKKLKIEKYFKFLGFRQDVEDLLQLFDIFLLPSLYEGLPNVVLEAMASAKPVIATAVDGTVEAVETGITGFLIPSEKPEAISKTINFLLKDPQKIRAMGEKGRKRAKLYFSMEKQIKQFEEMYDSLIAKKVKGILK